MLPCFRSSHSFVPGLSRFVNKLEIWPPSPAALAAVLQLFASYPALCPIEWRRRQRRIRVQNAQRPQFQDSRHHRITFRKWHRIFSTLTSHPFTSHHFSPRNVLKPSAVIPALTMTAPTLSEHGHETLTECRHLPHGQFKKHKVLPRPGKDRSVDDGQALPVIYDAATGTAVPSGSLVSQTSSPRTLKHRPRRIGTGPDLPPTPPNCSRASSGSHPAQPPGSDSPDAEIQTPQASSKRPPATPPDQRSPPTPDETPPQPANRARAPRPFLGLDRDYPRTATATTDSRTESFKTAREEPISSEDEAAMSTTETVMLASSTPSQTTVLRFPVSTASRAVQPQALDFALERLKTNSDEFYTPRTRGELAQLDGEWGSTRHVEREWDDNLQSAVSVGRREPKSVSPRKPQLDRAKNEALEDKVITPTNATEAVRSMSLKEAATVRSTPKSSPQSTPQRRRTGVVASRSEASRTMQPRRSTGLSIHSAPSTVIEAILVDSPSPLQRQRTLRHVRKRRELKESSPRGQHNASEGMESPPVKVSPLSNSRDEIARRHDSYTSTTSTNSMVSGRARREVRKSGGIPVVVIPDRRSSHKSKSREPSLRSSSSRHSRTRSGGSSPLDRSPFSSEELSFDRQSRRDRSTSVSDGSDQRTMDFPPIMPTRSSSLSAPTSRTTSRSGSLTVESVKALNEMHRHDQKSTAPRTTITAAAAAAVMVTEPASHTATQAKVAIVPTSQNAASPIISIQSPQTSRSDGDYGQGPFGADHHDDAASARKHSSRTTPFSVMSMETNWTAPEVSEAQAVHMYPHQNSSVLRINHPAKPQDATDATDEGLEQAESNETPGFTTTSPEVGVLTPEQRQSLEEVDSPLRNPRSPPNPPVHPPAINFIPATPSGLTPAEERLVQLGNFHEVSAEKPGRRPSLVRRALSRRRHSISSPPSESKRPGFLTRTFSVSRNERNSVDLERPGFLNPDVDLAYGQKKSEPAEQDKLHPHWRPQWANDAGDCDCSSCRRASERVEEIYRYPPIDNRPRPLKRSLSAKVKNIFTILPTRPEYQYHMDDVQGPERRTIRRTPSGNLKVMRRRSSENSLKRQSMGFQKERRPASEGNSQKGFWRVHSSRRRRSSDRLRRSSSLSSRFERMPSLTRKWSERRREKRTQELRQMISGPREVRDGVGEVIRSSTVKNPQAHHPN